MGRLASKPVPPEPSAITANAESIALLQGAARDASELQRESASHKSFLARSADHVDLRISENGCPSEKLANFEIMGTLSEGAFGDILMVKNFWNKNVYALKVMPKSLFDSPDLVRRAIYEKKLAYALRFDFLNSVLFAFQDSKNLYLGTYQATYGDLLRVKGKIKTEVTFRYMAVQIILGIEYLHACLIAHRDLKPDNILISGDYYLKITDFGVSKKIPDRSYSCCGTALYQAPEITEHRGHGKSADWWSLGILLFEIWYGRHPFEYPHYGYLDTLRAMKQMAICFPEHADVDSGLNVFISGLIRNVPSARLGGFGEGIESIKIQPWFHDIFFTDVLHQRVKFDGTLEVQALGKAPNFDALMFERQKSVPDAWSEF